MSVRTAAVPASPPLPAAAIVGTVLVIAGDVMLFAGLLFVFWVLRLAAPVWPPPLQPRLPIGVTALNTVALLASGVAVGAGVRAARRADAARLTHRLGVGVLLGALFVVVQGLEWMRLVRFGLTVTSGTYGALFYTVIGAHALHVLAALAWLVVVLALVRRARVGHASVEACALYWRFVVALWPVLYVCVYLL